MNFALPPCMRWIEILSVYLAERFPVGGMTLYLEQSYWGSDDFDAVYYQVYDVRLFGAKIWTKKVRKQTIARFFPQQSKVIVWRDDVRSSLSQYVIDQGISVQVEQRGTNGQVLSPVAESR